MSDDTNIVNMAANAPAIPPLPPDEEIVTSEVLEGIHRTTLSLAQGFSGVSDPTVIWTSMVRDFRTAFIYYRELEEKDDDVSSALEMLKLAVLGRERSVQPGDDSSQAQEAADFVQAQLDQVPSFHEVLEAMLDAPAYGVAIAEILFDVSEGQVGLIDIKDRPQELFSFNPQYMLQNGPMRLMSNPFAIDGGELVPEEKFLIYTFRPRSGNRRGRPLLRRVFWPSWFKRQALRMWLRYGEKGPGTAAVMYPNGANQDEKQKALAAAEAIVEKIAIAIPENFSMVKELLTSARAQSPSVYENLINQMAANISRAIVGQTLTSRGNEGGTGSKALGGVHMKMFFLKDVEAARKLETVINDQLVKPLVLWNFGPNVAMPKFVIDKEDEEDLVQRILIDRNAQGMGVPITQEYMLKRYGYEAPEAGDVILTPPQGAAATAIGSGAASIPSFSDAEAKRNADEVSQILKAWQLELGDLYAKRVHDIAYGIQYGGLQ
jgi:phage gp29-like protein